MPQSPPPRDSLERLVSAAQEEGGLDAAGVRAFVDALHERAARLLDERVTPLEGRLKAVEKERDWRLEQLEALRQEKRRLEDESARLKREREALQEQWSVASAAHDRLLAHHRAVLATVVEALELGAGAGHFGLGRVRTRLAETADRLRKELA